MSVVISMVLDVQIQITIGMDIKSYFNIVSFLKNNLNT